jgi:pimeloyl-ACP methyl ester carboxylesterase
VVRKAPGPSKEGSVFNGAGHCAHFHQPAEFANLMSVVLNETVTANWIMDGVVK